MCTNINVMYYVHLIRQTWYALLCKVVLLWSQIWVKQIERSLNMCDLAVSNSCQTENLKLVWCKDWPCDETLMNSLQINHNYTYSDLQAKLSIHNKILKTYNTMGQIYTALIRTSSCIFFFFTFAILLYWCTIQCCF